MTSNFKGQYAFDISQSWTLFGEKQFPSWICRLSLGERDIAFPKQTATLSLANAACESTSHRKTDTVIDAS